MKTFLKKLLIRDAGSVSVEYALIALTIAIGLIPVVNEIADSTWQLYAPLPGMFEAVTD